MDQYTVPDDIDFEYRKEGKELHIGPVLGIVRGNNFPHLNRSRNVLLPWVKDYHNIKGLVIIFPLSEVYEGAKSIKGYYYNLNNPKKRWEEGTFPIPSAVFNKKTGGVGKRYRRLFEELTNGRFINSSGTGKWEFFSALFNNPATKSKVPYTEKFQDFKQLFTMLNKYGVLYLKRRYGSRGYGIIQVKKLENLYEVTRVLKDTQKKDQFETENELKYFLESLITRNGYIIQQGVLYQANQKQVDFRAYIQKDGSLEWKVSGFIGRLAQPNSVITNIRYTQKILPGKAALMEFYGLVGEDTDRAAKKIEEACILAGQSMDINLGHFGDVALDFILDSQGNVYFLEVNAGYGHKIFREIRDYELRERILKSPLEYAKALAGFSVK
nr:YheC/YheD family protein [Neobacillus terrae]